MNDATAEWKLIQRVADGDRMAFGQLYKRYIHNLYGYIFLFTHSKELSEDIIQEIFIRIWEIREAIPGIGSFEHYLFRMAKNKVIDHIRHQQVKDKVAENIIESAAASTSIEADHKILYDQYYDIASEAVAQLPEKRRLIFRLRTEESLSLDEISEQLGVSKSVVKKQLYAAIGHVKRYLHEHAGFSFPLLISLLLPFIG